MKKSMILVLIFVGVFLLVFVYNNVTKKNIYSKNNYVITSIDNMEKILNKKENFLIYAYANSCYFCKESNQMISFYEKAYSLKIYRMNLSNVVDSKVREYFNLSEGALNPPAVIFIKKGNLKAIDNMILNEDYFRDYLLKYGYIDSSYYENDYRIDYKEFQKKYQSSNKNVFLFYNYGENVSTIGEKKKKEEYRLSKSKIREELLRLTKEHPFSYRVIFYHVEGADRIYDQVRKDVHQKKIEGPFIIITENSHVVDYLIPRNKKEISSFLEKNGIYK